MAASPDDIQNIIEGTGAILAFFSVLPAAIIAPIVMIGRGIAGIASNDDKDEEEKE